MQELLQIGGFVLRKWKSSELAVLKEICHKLVDSQSTQSIDIVYGMEHHLGYLSTSGLIAEECRDANQVNIAIGHSMTVRCPWLVLSSNRQA